MDQDLIVLTDDECWELLAGHDFGRIAIVHDGFPEVFPINYQVPDDPSDRRIVFHTRPDNVIDRHGATMCLQIDGRDIASGGWTVLARGHLAVGGPWHDDDDDRSKPVGHDTRRSIVVTSVSGRRLLSTPLRWAFSLDAYL